ncbi:MAG: hypothetical protein IKL65_04335 [Bacilli bacterium]|nr:hypothetical protein [Bacilli bacterium]
MKCSRCNGKIVDCCCVKCGYLENGNKIENKEIDKNEDLKLFNKDFDIINRNKNLLLIFILGPLYFSYRGYFFLGTILGLIDLFAFYYSMNLLSIAIFIFGSTYVSLFYLLINRLIYIIFANYICVLIDKLKVKRIKKKYKEDYKNKLKEYKHNKYYLLITLIIYLILFIMFIISKGIKNGLF